MENTPQNILLLIGGLAALAIVAIVALSVASSTPSFKKMLVGVTTDPQVVGLVRALAAYVIPVAAGAALAYLGNVHDPRLLPIVPVLVGCIRIIEGRLDKNSKPGQNDKRPPAVAGSGGGDPSR